MQADEPSIPIRPRRDQRLSWPDAYSVALLLDLDGTLVDTSPDIIGALVHSLEKFGYRACDDCDLRSSVGDGSLALASRANAIHGWNQSDELLAQIVEELDRHYLASPTNGSSLMPGALDLLTVAGELGVFRAIYSNKPQSACEKVLKELGVIDRFETILGSGSFAEKPDPAGLNWLLKVSSVQSNRCVFIGDTYVDELAAKAAGCTFLCVDFGFRPPSELSEACRISSLATAISHLRAM